MKATFGAGCFWHVEDLLDKTKGVKSTKVGYIGGQLSNPTYEEVCTDKTGHAEAVEVEYDPDEISYKELLDVFWNNHNPTTLNRQGPDIGIQYRSAIFYHDDEQKEIAEKSKQEQSARYEHPIVTEIVPAPLFYKAEEYHQKYFKKHRLS
ncbi:MAG: peptide-methionine (S)-S-oxide reductase MsrA [Nitrosopumilus sp.]|nr:peptide-methionine (S)-S-oxide reductase MsrA [Nitrosopumilus sp.]MDH3515495.1 peptide-methionine (S)-S-oxide reductase MsrA [Nitrosopumilus sp.]MDH3565562.1 peptide-methionine (S)-S-oxide reductase MsrA [Nitrosopumilus sp.]MDH5416740.1 peptide-methionine (S)-S-oxide reductase MsrA [Nitrosopumilus sp.]MDH5555204.1 peptide-methionine (S)-S-oxide reductase MsrA [Nitrosopumilus sp.]